ncbi:type II secretion system F family protein [Turicibacter sanguinis]|uniref:type II secretion system F family protein n=1 Tax=Turicibacter sanguinis TaxID=154288 RepID=UPI0011CA800F|nr:type II secretion system F family protein [Turicibacter sanguinis]
MAKFKYRALTSTNEKVEGVYEAKSKDEVLAIISSNGYYPLMIEEVIESTNINLGLKKKVKLKDIAVFCRQFYTMVDAGVQIDNCLDILSTQLTHPELKKALTQVHEDVQRGESLYESMSKHEEEFPELLLKMIQSGEVSGNLDTILLRMSVYYEKENKMNAKVKNAMIYPSILAIVAAGAVTVILTFVMPTFIEMFNEMGVELPWLTKALLWTSDFMTSNALVLIVSLFAIIFVYRMYSRTDHGKYTMSQLKLALPIVKPLNQKIIVSRFTRTLSTLLSSGMPLAQSIQIVSDVVQNTVAEQALLTVRDELVKGEGLSGPMKDAGIFPPMLSSMIHIGEETGALDEILNKTADFYDDELEAQIQATTALIEPLLIVVMGIIIGAIVLAIMIPMFEMYTQM